MANAQFDPAEQGTSPCCSDCSCILQFFKSGVFLLTFLTLGQIYTNNPVNAVRLWVEDYKQLQWFEFL